MWAGCHDSSIDNCLITFYLNNIDSLINLNQQLVTMTESNKIKLEKDKHNFMPFIPLKINHVSRREMKTDRVQR